jgi:HD-like signal output (HDOD) protein
LGLDDFLVDLPPIPAVALKVLHLTEDPDSSAELLAHTIASDPAITIKVMQFSNSAYYGNRRQVTTLRQAVQILGLEVIRSLVLLFSIPASLKGSPRTVSEEKALWEHALAVGVAARLMGRKLPGLNSEGLFLAGFLHDVGKSVLLLKSPDKMVEALGASWPPGGSVGLDVERRSFGFDHSQVGSRVLDEWTFPDLYVQTTLGHHGPAADSQFAAETRVVAAANRVAHSLGLGGPADPRAWEEALAMAEGMRITAEELEALAVTTVNHVTSERELYGL